MITLQPDTIDDLQFWLHSDWSNFSTPIWPTSPPGSAVDLFVDASALGWGAWIAFPSRVTTSGFFSPQERQGSSTLREIVGLLYALQAFITSVRTRRVRVFTDNQNVPRVQSKGSAVPILGHWEQWLSSSSTYASRKTSDCPSSGSPGS